MITLMAPLLGGVVGYFWASNRGGNGFDKAQYTAVFSVLFGLVTFVLSVIAVRFI